MSEPAAPAPSASPAPAKPADEQDAPLKEIVFYGLGAVELSLSNQFMGVLNTLMIVILGVNPLLLGLILSIKTLWDGFADPVMAQITDNTRTRWGRRRPFILVGGVARSLLLVAIFAFFPQSPTIKSNEQYAREKEAAKALAAAKPTPAPASPPVVKPANSPVAAASQNPAAPGAAPVEANTPADVHASGSGTSASAAPAAAPAASTPAPAAKTEKPGLLRSIQLGFAALTSSGPSYERTVTIYVLVCALIFTTFGAIINVPYYALGIELAPSYDGRTRVVTYRSMIEKVMGVLMPWVMPLCFSTFFPNVLHGLRWYAFAAAAIGVPTVILMVRNTKERVEVARAKGKGPNLFKSIWQTARSLHFLKILFLYQFIGFAFGIFLQVSNMLTFYWVFADDVSSATDLNAIMATLATVLAFASLPLINWACRRFEKHRTLRIAIIWMCVGTALKWFVVTPANPYLQLVLPFFFSVGISSIFTILPTMMADVTDMDEMANGVRREGMFGAVMGFLNKITSAIQPLIANFVLVASGFDQRLGGHQSPDTILNMRLLFSFIPAVLLLFALVALWRYPLTREYMGRIKEQLVARRAAAKAAAGATAS